MCECKHVNKSLILINCNRDRRKEDNSDQISEHDSVNLQYLNLPIQILPVLFTLYRIPPICKSVVFLT